jgi:hypothetical protein
MSAPASDLASVISLAGRPGRRPDYRGLASSQIRAARESLRLSHEGFAAHLSEMVGWAVTAGHVARWEDGSVPPGDVLLAAGGHAPERALLEGVPPSLTADTLAGLWVTCYRFSPPQHFHADIARIEAVSARQVRITNSLPEPRTEGHAVPFRNEIEALLSSRHLTGQWKNTSDARYFGGIHLAVMPGETVMEGFYTNFADDVTVGTGHWKWARVEPGSLAGADLSAMILREPAEIGALLEHHSYCDAPLSLTDLGKVA